VFRLTATLSFALISLACPSEIKPGLPAPGDGSGAPLKGKVGAPCDASTLCELGLVCEQNTCVPLGGDGNVDAGASVVVHPDGGTMNPPTGTPQADAGVSLLDAGQETQMVEEVLDAGPPPEPVIPWLLSVENASDTLIKIDTVTGNWTPLCLLSTTDSYNSTTFGFDGTLYGSNATQRTLDIIDPCTCDVTEIGPTNWGSIPGITANGDKIETLFGLSTSTDKLVTLDIETGAGTEVGPLGSNFLNSGTTWAEDINGLYSINSNNSSLHNIDIQTGFATVTVGLDIAVGAVGIEWHPDDHKLYFCTDPSSLSYLYEVNTTDGTTTQLGLLPGRCTNLAAPWTPVPCVDEVVVE
tara:strand:- start:6048 stop:7109 length:1062 start_codon:yes stop_codon:yes gene_type:complete